MDDCRLYKTCGGDTKPIAYPGMAINLLYAKRPTTTPAPTTTPMPTIPATSSPTQSATDQCDEKKQYYCSVLGDPHVRAFGSGGQARGPLFELQGEVGKTYVIANNGIAEISATLSACGAGGLMKCLGKMAVKVGQDFLIINGDKTVSKNCFPPMDPEGTGAVIATSNAKVTRMGTNSIGRVKHFKDAVEYVLQVVTDKGTFDIKVLSTGYRLDIRIGYESCEVPGQGACVLGDITKPAPVTTSLEQMISESCS